jgi:D-amino-acid oxidase
VQREQIGDTAVVHNYGHGGGGITLSWGSAKLAVDLGAPGHVGPAAVLGSGVIGLTTARMLQDLGLDVTIYTRALPPETTSNIAGGQWGPSNVYGDSGQPSQRFTDQYVFACKFAYERFQIMTDPRYGVRWMRNYLLSDQPRTPHAAPFAARSQWQTNRRRCDRRADAGGDRAEAGRASFWRQVLPGVRRHAD